MAMFIRRLIASLLLQIVIFGGLLFLPAGTLAWRRAWIFLGVVVIATVGTMIGVFRTNQDLLNERFKPPIQKGQPLADRIILILFLAAFCGVIAFIPLDVFRFHLMGRPGRLVSFLGLALVAVGWWMIAIAFRENAFAAPVVKYQEERLQTVIDSGIYGVVRHPMYAGFIPLIAGMSLWLRSYAGALLAIVPIGMLALRILFEERFLRRELRGYDAYTERVRYRLIPFVW